MTNKTNQGREICEYCGKEMGEGEHYPYYPCFVNRSKPYSQPLRANEYGPDSPRFEPIPQQPPQEPEGKDAAIANELLNINDTCRSRGFEAGPSGRATSDRVIALAQAYDAAKRDGEAAINSLNEASKMAMEMERTQQARIEELVRERDELATHINDLEASHMKAIDEHCDIITQLRAELEEMRRIPGVPLSNPEPKATQ